MHAEFLTRLLILFTSDDFNTSKFYVYKMFSRYLVLSLLLIVTLALGGLDGVGEEDENGLVLYHAFAVPTIATDPDFHSLHGPSGGDFRFYIYHDIGEIIITPVVTSNITGSNLNYTWVSTTYTGDIDALGVNSTSTLHLTSVSDDYYDIHYDLYAFDDESSSIQSFRFSVDSKPIINITSANNPHNISVGDSFIAPEIACIYSPSSSAPTDLRTTPRPTTIDTSTVSSHIITYTCHTYTNWPAVTKTLLVNVGNPLPPAPLSLSITLSSMSVFEGGTITLTSSHTGGDGTSLTYSWSSNPDTTGVLSSTSTQNSVFTAPAVDSRTSYTITLEANDSTYRNSTTVSITVLDDPAPIVNIPGPNPLTIAYSGVYAAPAVTCTDNDADSIDPVPSTSSIVTSTPGDTHVTFTCTDSKGQAGTAVLIVRVNQPENAPTVTIAGNNPLHVPYSGDYTEPDVTCVDHQDVAIDPSSITSDGAVDTSEPGSYAITYTCTDINGPGAKTLTVIVGNRPPTITPIDSNPVVERTTSFTPSDVVACSDDFNRDIQVTHRGLNTQVEGTYLVTFTCTSPTTRLSAEPVEVSVSVTDTQPPEFLSAKYTPKTGILIITFNEDLASTTSSSAFTIRSQGETSGGLTLTDATPTTQNRAITVTLTDEQKETFQTISSPHLFIAANTISDTANSPNAVTDEITDKRIIIAVKKKSGSSVPPPIVDLTALKASSFDVDIPESVLDILESYDQSSPIEPVMECKIIFSFSFVTDGACYALGGKVNTIQPHQVGLNQQTNLTFTAYSSSGVDHFVMFLNLDGDNTSYTLSDTYVTYLNGRVTVTDPHNYIADATVTIEQDDEQSFQYTILTVIEFDGEMGLTNLVARIWNDNSRATVIQIIDALNVVSITEQSELVEETVATTTTTTTTATALTTSVSNAESVPDDDDILHSIKMWAGFDSQSISDSELLESLNLDYPDADIPNWMMVELAVLVVSGDLTVDEFKTALVFVLDAL